jgi:hypothetical protein
MANSILNELESELKTLEGELSQFKSAVDYLNGAKDKLTGAITAVNKAENYHLENLARIENVYANLNVAVESVKGLTNEIKTVDFPTRLTSIDENLKGVISSIDQSTKSTLAELKKASGAITQVDFEAKFQKLDHIVNTSVSETRNILLSSQKESKAQIEMIEKGLRSINDLINKTAQEQKLFFTSLKLEAKFETLEIAIGTANAAAQNIQGRLDMVERNLKERIEDSQVNLKRTLEKAISDFNGNISTQSKNSKNRDYISIALVSVLLIAILLLKFFVK